MQVFSLHNMARANSYFNVGFWNYIVQYIVIWSLTFFPWVSRWSHFSFFSAMNKIVMWVKKKKKEKKLQHLMVSRGAELNTETEKEGVGWKGKLWLWHHHHGKDPNLGERRKPPCRELARERLWDGEKRWERNELAGSPALPVIELMNFLSVIWDFQ